MQIQTKPITLLSLAKLAIYGIFLNYYCFNILRGSLLPYGTVVFYAVSVACVIFTAFGDNIYIGTEIKLWIAYVLISVLSIAFAVDSKTAFDGITVYIQRLILIMIIAYICEKEKSVMFAVRVIAVSAFACAVSALLKNESVSTKLTMTTGANISTNDIGSLMAFGCFAILFFFGINKKRGLIKSLIIIGYIIAAISVIFIAGSRKSILAIIILFISMFLFCARDLFKSMSAAQTILVTLLIIGAAVFVYFYLLPNVESTDMYQRLYGRKVEGTAESDELRIEMYIRSLKDFATHPLFGLGFNNTSYVYSAYSHSAYVEPLACSGIFGLLYLAPYVTILVKQIKLIKLNKHSREERLWQKELLAFYISFLFVGIGIPYIYKDIPCIVFALFIASQKISFDKLKEAEESSVSNEVNHEPVTNKSLTSYS